VLTLGAAQYGVCLIGAAVLISISWSNTLVCPRLGPELITLTLGNFSPPRAHRKKGPSEIDKLEPYNMAHDLLNQKANITYGQMLEYSNQQRNLALALKRPFLLKEIPTPPLEMMEANIIQPKES
ncbi:5153_t:CDS:2, partial [Cetraspora pellucida]